MKTHHATSGPRAVRRFSLAMFLMVPALLCVAVPLIREGFSWSNAFILIGAALLAAIPLSMHSALETIQKSDKAAREAGDEVSYLDRLFRDD